MVDDTIHNLLHSKEYPSQKRTAKDEWEMKDEWEQVTNYLEQADSAPGASSSASSGQPGAQVGTLPSGTEAPLND